MKALEEALVRHGAPEILNVEHGRAPASSSHTTSGQTGHVHQLHQGAGRPQQQDQHHG